MYHNVKLFFFMTRAEQKELRLKEEKKLISSLRNRKIDSKLKGKFRSTSIWKDFRKTFSKRKDALTGKKLNKGYNLHHLNLNPERYTDLTEGHFVPLNSASHDCIHFLYGYYRKDPEIIVRLVKILEKMKSLNDGKDIRDFR